MKKEISNCLILVNKIIFYLIITLLSITHIKAQKYTIKNDSFGYFILYKDNVEFSKILNSPGELSQYIVLNDSHVCLLISIQGLITNYINLKLIDNFWTHTDTDVMWFQDQKWPYKVIKYKLLGEDIVEQFENIVSIGLVDFTKIIASNLKQKKDKQDFIKKYNESKKNKK